MSKQKKYASHAKKPKPISMTVIHLVDAHTTLEHMLYDNGVKGSWEYSNYSHTFTAAAAKLPSLTIAKREPNIAYLAPSAPKTLNLLMSHMTQPATTPSALKRSLSTQSPSSTPHTSPISPPPLMPQKPKPPPPPLAKPPSNNNGR